MMSRKRRWSRGERCWRCLSSGDRLHRGGDDASRRPRRPARRRRRAGRSTSPARTDADRAQPTISSPPSREQEDVTGRHRRRDDGDRVPRQPQQLDQGAVEELGFSAEIFDSQEDPNRQLQGIEGSSPQGADAIIVTGLGGESIGPAAEEATPAGHLRRRRSPGRDLSESGAVTISVEEEDIATAEGTAAGEYAAANYPDGGIQMVITDYPSIESLVARADMIEESFTAVYPDAEFLAAHPRRHRRERRHVDGDGAAGEPRHHRRARHQRRRQPRRLPGAGERRPKTADDVFIFGIDCDPQAVELIDSGTMYKGCVDTNPVGTGELAADAFALWLAGGTVPGIIEVPVSVYTGAATAPATTAADESGSRDDRMTALAATDARRGTAARGRPWPSRCSPARASSSSSPSGRCTSPSPPTRSSPTTTSCCCCARRRSSRSSASGRRW